MRKLIYTIGLITLIASTSGCATPTSMSYNMTAFKEGKTIETKEPLQKSIIVGDVTGASPKRSYWLNTFLTNPELKTAIEKSLQNISLLNHDNTAKYSLSAHLVSKEHPIAMFNVTVVLTMAYELTEIASNDIVWRKSITSTATKKPSDSMLAPNRAVMANEQAIKDNIKKLIQKLKKAEFKK